MKLQQVIEALEAIAPTRLAEAWDNVGLLVGDAGQDVSRAMVCIDYTPHVACESAGEKADLIIAYHPPIFDALKRVVLGGPGSTVFDAIRRGVAIYSPHTALDVADGGTNDMLADVIGIAAADRRPLRLSEVKAKEYKLVTFVPAEHVERVAAALFAAGAGRIGNYTQCSFRSEGTGTFFGEAGTNPAVGQSGKLERAPEVRLETVLPIAKLSDAIEALRSSHPYEEPAFDLVQLPPPTVNFGQGRIGKIPPTPREEILDRLRHGLGIQHLLVAGPLDGEITKVACCAGACGDMLNDAINAKAELYVTGEMRHHDALRAANAGMTVVCTLHSNSERAVLARLKERLTKMLPPLAVVQSKMDRDPFSIA